MSKKQLTDETLQSAIEYNERLIQGIKHYISLVDKQQTEQSYNLLADIIEGLEWLIKAISLTSDAQKVKMDVDKLNEHFTEMAEAIENSDFLLLTDILKYEIIEMLEQWQRENFKN